jgi:hypothetical protein
MKPKMHYQVQPREIAPPRTEQAQVQHEIQSFLRAVDSYPARVAKEPRVSFPQHLRSDFAADRDDRHDDRTRRQ